MMNYPKNKYNAKKCIINGVKCDSEKEARRVFDLQLLEKSGEISDLKFQYPFLLQKSFSHNGKNYKKIEYIADAIYKEKGKLIVEDTKSFITQKNPVYRLKKKLLLYRYPEIEFKENI